MLSYQLFVESLEARFLYIQRYQLDYQWRIREKELEHSVLWHLEKGSFHMEMNGERYVCHEGDTCLLPNQSIINCNSFSGDIRLISLNFDAEITFLHHRSWAHVFNLPVVYKNGQHEWSELILEMLREDESEDAFTPLLMQSHLLRLLSHMLKQSLTSGMELPSQGGDTRIHTIIDYLLCHPNRMPRITDLADLIHVSESHLRRLFIRETGQSPLQFVHKMKIEQARKLLLGSNKPIAEIAEELGLANPNYFSRLFKIETGVAPQSFRKQYRPWSRLDGTELRGE